MEVVKIENVTRTYQIGKLETHALRGVSLQLIAENSQPWWVHPVQARPRFCK